MRLASIPRILARRVKATLRPLLCALLLGCSGAPITASEPAAEDAHDAGKAAGVDAVVPIASEPAPPVPVVHYVWANSTGFYPSETIATHGDSILFQDLAGFHLSVSTGFMGMRDGICHGPLPLRCALPMTGPVPFFLDNDRGVVGIALVR